MSSIKTITFNKEGFEKLKNFHFGKNWPIVYILEDGKRVYIGETFRAYSRAKQHYDKEDRRGMKNMHLIFDEEYNKSATLDTESWLIQYMLADGMFNLQNGNAGLQNHEYYNKPKYEAKFKTIWDKLKNDKKIVKGRLIDLKNSDLFKYSPYKKLTDDQLMIAEDIKESINKNDKKVYMVKGKPGTGKTVLATYLFKQLKDSEKFNNLEMGLVIPQSALRDSIRKVFKNITNLYANMVLGPNDVVKKNYDLLIVDEAHRLKQRKNIMGYGAFDKVNKKLGLGKRGNQLDWVLNSAKYKILFYDENQTVRPSDIHTKNFKALNTKKYELMTQVRVEGGENYVNLINDFFDFGKIKKAKKISDYDFRIYDNIEKMVNDIKEKNKKYGLSRMVAGYAWPWRTKNGEANYDIEIDGYRLLWNKTTLNWINTKSSIEEVGCIHTVQGYDLNYAGVIIGPDISYDPFKKDFIIHKSNYYDFNGKRGIENSEELKRYIINIYKVLLTRGIKGTYVYIVDDNLRKYFRKYLSKFFCD